MGFMGFIRDLNFTMNLFSIQKIYSDFELQGVMEDKLNSKAYQTVANRMQAEEATCQMSMPEGDDDGE